jgi:excisionase family DNA binding protein
MSTDQLLTAEQLADRLSVKPGTVSQWRRAGKIPAIRLSPKVVRFNLQAVVDALAERERQREAAK